ncbi:hypothetical protein BDK51DRAFT_35306 [Blyttiomyces helicus]|uniref:NAD(P)-binding protein n=1 Tax=Blyttiomyces helicus TaxID=388810 RepID=A0A4P9WDB1_9FUNG|nr:hypothetical protein BDK51DRAFT_35306 [Blyttiomyces helicus]|eukprot:RKO89695.1 hypothetical protein BDK51DRAFT_35306 [Blyttiomyces helicus]
MVDTSALLVDRSKGFTRDAIPDLSGKVAIVTGANTGVGYATALELARKNATVFMACRSEERAAPAVEKVRAETGNKNVHFLKLDLQNLKQSREAAKGFLSLGLGLHILVNNAGIMACPFALTSDGIESQFATNHLGHFVFTKTLLPALERSAPSRIVNLSSVAHKHPAPGGILFDSINDPKAMGDWGRYGQSKLSNILFSRALDKRYGEKGIYVNSVHPAPEYLTPPPPHPMLPFQPGYVNSELTRGVKQGWVGWIMSPLIWLSNSTLAIPPYEGALTSLYVATSPEIETNDVRAKYFVPIASERTDLSSEYSKDETLAEKLWAFSEKLVEEKIGKE